MNKKIFASAIFAVAAFVSTIASADITYTNSVTDGAYAQDDNAVVSIGGGSVRGNDLIVTAGACVGAVCDIPAEAEIIVRLPVGVNFDGAPSYKVTPATPTLGLTLEDATEFGDPTLDAPGVELFDTNGDGGMDRAVIAAAAASKVGDKLVISTNLTANSEAKAGVQKASVIVNNGLAVVQEIAEVASVLAEPVSGSTGTALSSVDQNLQTDVGTSTATIIVTIPAGTANGKLITVTPQSKVQWASTTSTLTVKELSPVAAASVTIGTQGQPSATSSITLTTVVGGPVGSVTKWDIQIELGIDQANSLPGAVGKKGVAISGNAGISGTAALFDVKANGSTAEVTKVTAPAKNDPVDIVAGSTAVQMLPDIDITENFDGDAVDTAAGSMTITVTPGTGLVFAADTSTITVDGTGWALTGAAVSGVNGKLTLTMSNAVGGSATVTVSDIGATAKSTAEGGLWMTVGSPTTPDKSTGPNDNLMVANAVTVGTVDLSLKAKTKTKITGPGASAVTSTITLTETTYGSITKADETQVQDAFFRVTPVGGATIVNVLVSDTGYPATAPAFMACVAETGTIAWICEVTGESTAITPTTSTISVDIGYKANGKPAVGSTLIAAVVGGTIEMTFDGNASVEGTVKVADVGVATSATKGAVPDLTPGDTEAQKLAKLTVKELFAGAISAGNFRLIAPSGVTFNNADSVASTSSAGGVTATPTITATFSPNDTLVINVGATPSVSFTAQAVIGPNASEWISFDIVDGDINGANGAGITAESIMLAYADGTLGAVDAGDDVDLNAGFAAVNTAEGGLAPYTVKSSDEAVATVTVSGDTVTVTGKGAGMATITVTDELGGSDSYVATIVAGTAQPDAKAPKGVGSDALDASFTGGASSDGGTTYADTFTTADDVTIVGTVNVATAHQGTNGEIHVVVLSTTEAGTTLAFLNEEGNFEDWDLSVAGLGAAEVATPLAASHVVTIFSGNLAAGTHKVALAYSTADGKLIYTGKAVDITVTE